MTDSIAPHIDDWHIPEALWQDVRHAYAAPGRYYHDARHLDEVVARFVDIQRTLGWRAPREVLLALLFHDAGKGHPEGNHEVRSMELARVAMPTDATGTDRVTTPGA